MQLHLTYFDVEALRKQAEESSEIGDDGELFAEEAVGCLSDEELEAIEEAHGGPADEFFMEVFATWEGGDPVAIIDTMVNLLGELDIDCSYDDEEDDAALDEDDDWEDDVEEPDDLSEDDY